MARYIPYVHTVKSQLDKIKKKQKKENINDNTNQCMQKNRKIFI